MSEMSNLFKNYDIKVVPSDIKGILSRGGVFWPDGTIIISVLDFFDWENRVYQGKNYKEEKNK